VNQVLVFLCLGGVYYHGVVLECCFLVFGGSLFSWCGFRVLFFVFCVFLNMDSYDLQVSFLETRKV